MKKTALILTSAVLSAALMGCGAPQEAESTPAPTAVVSGEVLSPTATITPEMAARKNEQADIERFLPESTFRDMTDSELAPYLEKLNGDFLGWGRTDDNGNAYILLQPTAGWPEEGYYSTGEVCGDETWYEVTRSDDDGMKVLYEVHGVAGLSLYHLDTGFGVMIISASDPHTYYAASTTPRILADVAKSRGMAPEQPETGDYLTLYEYDEQVRDQLGYSGPVAFYLALTEAETDELAAMAEKFEPASKDEVKKVRTYRTGVYVTINGVEYTLRSGGLVRSEGEYFNAPELLDWAENRLSLDLDGYSVSWFDGELGSATLDWPAYSFNDDGTSEVQWRSQTVSDKEKLARLTKLLKGANLDSDGKCPMVAKLVLTRTDGETLTVWVAADSCATGLVDGRVWLDYGHQEDMAKIFDEAMAN